MALELIKTQYFVKQQQYKELCDSICLGASDYVAKASIQHGPFETEKEAKEALLVLEEQAQREGWQKSADGSFWYRGDYDLYLSIEKSSQALGVLVTQKL